MNEVIQKKKKKKKKGMGVMEWIFHFHKFSIMLIFKWIGKKAFIVGAFALIWFLHTGGIANSEGEKVFDFLHTFKWIGKYILRMFMKVTVMYILMLVMWGLNQKEWKEYINDKSNKNT